MYDPPVWASKTDVGYLISGKTFPIKDKLKEVQGAVWADGSKSWLLPKTIQALEKLRELKIPFKLKVKRHEFCHEPESIIFAYDYELKQGYVKRNFCTRCDSWFGQVPIEEVPDGKPNS